MSELTASHCGCVTENRCGGNCSSNSWIWIIILFFLFNNGGCSGSNIMNLFGNNNCGCNDCDTSSNCGCGGNFIWIIILLLCCNNA